MTAHIGALGVLWGTTAMLAACAPATRGTTSTMSRGVTEAVAAAGHASVLVTLRDPVGPSASGAEREAGVRAAQDAVVGGLPPGEFTVVHRYRSLPGLALVVTRAALERLRSDPRVVSIELDEPVAGGAPPRRTE